MDEMRQMKEMMSNMLTQGQGGGWGASAGKGKGKVGKPGDWNCPNCGDLVFGFRDVCKMCGTEKPEGAGLRAIQQYPNAKPGDWTCPSCNDLVFANRPSCR